jgi:S1-C subfamily serine protease
VDLVSGAPPEPEPAEERPSTRGPGLTQALGGILLLGALTLSLLAYLGQRGLAESERAAWQGEVGELERQVERVRRDLAKMSGRLGTTEQRVKRSGSGVAPLAERALRSVFTVETDTGLGAGFAAWTESGVLYVVTANHVVESARSVFVTVSRKGGSWTGQIVKTDRRNDLALIRVSGLPQGARPLWQNTKAVTPAPGDELILIGSPYGLAGTVTTGIVSRVTKKSVQTDAAANPGNSGGPALDRRGRIVGVLVAGGGQNLNFAIRIDRACVKLRDC